MNHNSKFYYFPESKFLQINSSLASRIDKYLWEIGSGEISPSKFSQQFGISLNRTVAILTNYAKNGLLKEKNCKKCPNIDCNNGLIWEDDWGQDCCPSCEVELTSNWRKSSFETHYIINKIGRQFSPWLLFLHGMNTKGIWQQQTVFKFGLRGEQSPYHIYKYGIKRIEPLFKWSQNCVVKSFIKKYKKASDDAYNLEINDPPDVIAHSFGTLIIGKALERDPQVCFGKILLCGSILRPDFDWLKYVKEGRVNSILNHYGGKDCWAKYAIHAIPGSGPSGRIGFIETEFSKAFLFNYRDSEYKHSDFFKDTNFHNQYNILWRPFLWGKLDDLEDSLNLHAGPAQWKHPSLIWISIICKWVLTLSLVFVALFLFGKII